MYRDTFFKSRVILNTCNMVFTSRAIHNFCISDTPIQYWRYSIMCRMSLKKVFSLSTIHKFCIHDTPNQRIPKKSRPVMIHPPYTHQSIDAYIIHVPAITDYHYLTSHYP